MARQSVVLDEDQLNDLKDCFKTLDTDGNGYISFGELQFALDTVGMSVPGYEMRDIINNLAHDVDKDKDQRLDINEFKELYTNLCKQKKVGHAFKKAIGTRKGVQTVEGFAEGITHSVKDTEAVAFSEWINERLKDDSDCASRLPIMDVELYDKIKDGILLCKLINKASPDTIDERTINKQKLDIYRCTENQNLALSSAASIGCYVVNIGPGDINKGTKHLVLGLLWQVIRIGLLSEVNLKAHPGLVNLLEEGETSEDLMKLSPEQILLRWVNYHLNRAGINRTITNFGGDIKDSEAYIHLLDQIAPREAGVNTMALGQPDLGERAESMLMEADKMLCRAFITNKDVVNGNAKLNLAFVANLFNSYPALENEDQEIVIVDETREEKTYRNWMNSMGVRPFVHHLYQDLYDGLVYFQLYDLIKPGCVNWSKVTKEFNKLKKPFQLLENCNYVVELGRDRNFSLVGISGNNIVEQNATLTLALVWQLMKAYTLSILSQIAGSKGVAEAEVMAMAKDKLKDAGKKRTFRDFGDKSLCNSLVILDLIDAIRPGKINYDIVKESSEEEDLLSNAKYAISMCRKIGARIYALHEDITEGKKEMIMTIFTCLMTLDLRLQAQKHE